MSRTFSSTEFAYRLLVTPPRKLKALGLSLRDQKAFQKQCAGWLEHAMSFGVGLKHTHGHNLRISALVICVKEKTAKVTDVSQAIPPLVYLPDGRPVLTDVEEQREPASVSLGPNDFVVREAVGEGGTATAIVRKQSGISRLMLGCWHVLAFPNGATGDVIEKLSGGARTKIGKLSSNHAVISLNSTAVQSDPDYALVAIDPSVVITNGLGGPFAPQPATSLRSEELVSVRSHLNGGTVSKVKVIKGPAAEPITFGAHTVMFADVYRINAASIKGDSGAPVVNEFNQLVGYVIGDDATDQQFGTFTLIQPIWTLLKSKGLRLVTSASPVLVASAGAPAVNEVTSAIDTLARTLWGEARGETRIGRVAVAWVVLNRVRAQKKFYGLKIEEVCLKPKQFSCWNVGDENLPKIKKVTSADPVYVECLAIASDTVMDRLTPPDPTVGAKHYHTDPINERPKWSVGKVPSARIGKHVFFNSID